MLTKADDFPVHQRAEPIATAGTDRNFYDRYFFNGYTLDGHVFFAAALGVYPHLNVMDAAFSVICEGVQHNLRASRLLNMERMDTKVGPIAVEVIEPLRRLRVIVGENEHGIRADIIFTARAAAVEEPRFTFRQGPRTIMDYTRLTQNGVYEGFVEIKGRRIEIDSGMVMGTRDRSWGVRPIGLADPQTPAPPRPPQFYWLWAPLNFPDRFMLYHINADAEGRPWNTASVMGALDGEAMHMASCHSQLVFKSGTRHAKSAVIEAADAHGGKWRAELSPRFNFYMSGIGYLHPEWGHGVYKGENALGYDTYDLASVNEMDPRFWHVQAFVTARLFGPDVERVGAGVLEQLVIGPHAPSGFASLMDTAP
ncbi:MAG TPA: hypothetical protein VLW75_06760 [Rhizomicrobium sp.]|nr:hypothetical protein [Rhizomicrobium sp.]